MNRKTVSAYGRVGVGLLGLFWLLPTVGQAAGTEGAAFLDIPVGGGPAAMGSAYTALAHDAYAPTINPAGLGTLSATQFSGQHLSYLDSLHYEYVSFGTPLRSSGDGDHPTSAIGGSIQYLGSGNIDATDNAGAPNGTFSSYYASYNVSYGRAVTKDLALGLTSKLIAAKIEEAKASAYAVDLGSMYKVRSNVLLAATLTNLGTKLKFLNEGDSLPLAGHLAAAYSPIRQWLVTSEAVFPKAGPCSLRFGSEWRPLGMISLRAGYRTDTIKNLSPLAGVTAGMGINALGQEFSYAFVPYGDLGNTHYFSLLVKLGAPPKLQQTPRETRYHQPTEAEPVPTHQDPPSFWRSRYRMLWDLLNDVEKRAEMEREITGSI